MEKKQSKSNLIDMFSAHPCLFEHLGFIFGLIVAIIFLIIELTP